MIVGVLLDIFVDMFFDADGEFRKDIRTSPVFDHLFRDFVRVFASLVVRRWKSQRKSNKGKNNKESRCDFHDDGEIARQWGVI